MRVRRPLPLITAVVVVLLLLFLFAPPFGSISMPVPDGDVVEGCSQAEAETLYGETIHQISSKWRGHLRNFEFHSAWVSFQQRRYSSIRRITKTTNGWIAIEAVYSIPGRPPHTNVLKAMYMGR